MLQLEVIMSEKYDESTSSFVVDTEILELEHSLVSLSKWESKFEKPFFNEGDKTEEEIKTYVRMMAISQASSSVFNNLTKEHYVTINEYLSKKMTATWFNKSTKPKKRQRQVVTSELIYYWITSYEIPWEVQWWHLNRLLTLIEVFSEERNTQQSNKKGERRNTGNLAAERRALNEARRRELGTTG